MYILFNLSHYVKSYGHLVQNFSIYYDAGSPNMAMSRDPRSKIKKKIFFLMLHLILGKAAKFLVEKLSTSEVISQKPHRVDVENTQPPSALGLNKLLKQETSFHMGE